VPPAEKGAHAASSAPPAEKDTNDTPSAEKGVHDASPALPAEKDVHNASPAPPAEKGTKEAPPAPPADKDVAADDLLPTSPATAPTDANTRSALRVSCPEKYNVVLEMLEAEVEVPLWQSVVDAWLTLEHATGFKVSGKALPATGCPPAVSWWVQRACTARIPVGLETEDEQEDFYDMVVL
jgi:hypothetical protein